MIDESMIPFIRLRTHCSVAYIFCVDQVFLASSLPDLHPFRSVKVIPSP